MRILALEFSSGRRSVAAVEAGEAVAQEEEDGLRSSSPVRLIQGVLAQAGWQPRQVEGLWVGLGPGSFTGIRAAISLVQGWSLGLGAQVWGAPSHRAIAKRAQREGVRGAVSVILDAQREGVYSAGYDLTPVGVLPTEPLRLIGLDSVSSLALLGQGAIGPEVTRWVQGGTVVHPSASDLADWAAVAPPGADPSSLEPVTLRTPQFVRWVAPRGRANIEPTA